ncbi:MAG: hypothetical protein QHH80_03955 [Anaerolineae bacterium]|nr:hypothetical protein [Anaerolineae bacterium]
MGAGKIARGLVVAAFLVIAAGILAACDTNYDLVIENHTDQRIAVTLYDRLVYELQPCSVQIASIAGPGTPSGKGFRVSVRGGDGATLAQAEVQPQRLEGYTQPVILVRIPQEGGDACPAPVEGVFLLVVRNYSQTEATIWLGDARLGTVAPLDQTAFGPLPGTWADVKRVAIRDASNTLISYSARAEYSLGDIPRFFIGFTAPRARQ